MKNKTSILLSLGISAVLIAATILLIHMHSADMWMVNRRWGLDSNYMMGGDMGAVMVIFWAVLVCAVILLVSAAITGIRASQMKAPCWKKRSSEPTKMDGLT